jgi:hypothetical protein
VSKLQRFLLMFVCALACIAARDAAAADGKRNGAPSARIRNIDIVIRDVFDEPDLAMIYRAVNSLKVNTKEHVIRRELLFREGEPYDQFLVDETARVLRRLSFIGRVQITPKYDGDFVDVTVSVQDNWTLVPQISFSAGGGGSDSKSVGLSESNLLGFGKRTELLVADDEGRTKYEGVYDDIRLGGTFQRLLLGRFERSDGYRTVGLYGRPFRTLVDKDSWTSYVDGSNLVGRLFALGDERFIFRQKHEEVGGSYTLSTGDPEVLLRRLAVGYRYYRDNFQMASPEDFEDINLDPATVSQDPRLLAESRKFAGPFFTYEQISPDYISTNYVDRFEWTEDYNLGTEFTLRNDFAGRAFGSYEDTYIFNMSLRRGVRLGPKEFIRAELGTSARADVDGIDNGLIRGEWRYYNILGVQEAFGLYLGNHTLAAGISVDFGYDLDRDREFLSGASTGLRGYEDRTFTGDKRIIMNFEDRFHLVENVFNFVSLGGALFADVGGSSYDPLGRLARNQLYSDVGVGLRLGFPKSSGGGVVRIDLAFPLRADPEDGDKLQPMLLIGTGQVISARLRAESIGIERANVTVGQDR